jgi:DinB superfamily
MADADEMAFSGEVSEDGNVVLQADLVGDPETGVVRARATDGTRGPTITDVRLTDGVLRNVNLERTRFAEAVLEGADIWAWGPDLTPPIDGLRINGVEISPLLEAELDRRHPERQHLQGIDRLDRMRAAWPHVEAMWAPTVDRARGLPEEVLHQRVNDEFSFVETLRHLIFATDAWVRRAVRGEDQPFHAIARAFPYDSGTWSQEGTVPWSAVGIDVEADPTLEEVLAIRQENFAMIRATLAELDEERFQSTPAPQQTPGYPPGTEERPVVRCFRSIVNEEWWHHQYATRDLAVLTGA